jgi:hypothetical protein
MAGTLTPARVAGDLVGRLRTVRAAGQPGTDLLAEAAALVAEYEGQILRVEPEHCERVRLAIEAVTGAYLEYQRTSQVATLVQAGANSEVDSLNAALELLRGVLA